MTHKPTQLSAEAFEELRIITKSEIPESMTDDEIEAMGIGLLRLFSILSTEAPQPPKIELSDQDKKALAFLRSEIEAGRNPSVRGLAKEMGFRSSRSGFRLLNRFMEKGWVIKEGRSLFYRGVSGTP